MFAEEFIYEGLNTQTWHEHTKILWFISHFDCYLYLYFLTTLYKENKVTQNIVFGIGISSVETSLNEKLLVLNFNLVCM